MDAPLYLLNKTGEARGSMPSELSSPDGYTLFTAREPWASQQTKHVPLAFRPVMLEAPAEKCTAFAPNIT